jgi:hypothetical protein
MGSWVVFLGAGFGLTGLNSVSMKFLVCVDVAACSAFVPAGDEKIMPASVLLHQVVLCACAV